MFYTILITYITYNPSGAPVFTPVFSRVPVNRSLVLCVCFVALSSSSSSSDDDLILRAKRREEEEKKLELERQRLQLVVFNIRRV
jgi:hypothetical protein